MPLLRLFKRLWNAPYFLWLLLTLPGAVIVIRYVTGGLYYGEVLGQTGELAAQLLILTLAVTPLRLMFPGRRWGAWLMRRRRYFGLAVFGYALLHAIVYVVRAATLSRVLDEAGEPAMVAGWLALAIFLPLALTSNNWSMRWLRRGWKRLHRWVYLAAVLTFVHWVLAAFDPVPAVIHLSALAALEGYRIWATVLRRTSERQRA